MNRAAVIWIVLGLVVIAILVALAMNRPEDADSAIQETATTTEQMVDRNAVRATAAADLTALQARIEAGETYETLEDEFAEVRADLAAAYRNAEGRTAEEWDEISAEFDAFEASARSGTSNVLDALAQLIASFSADVRVETETE